jgi:uncharacterized protein with NRDE domain
MCIVLVTTAHPDYSLIIVDNRDEFILRPTSRPHWWTSGDHEILSARDLQRAEQGTWMGITKAGKFAVLTNYRETDTHDADHPIQGARSRGGMVTAWLESPKEEDIQHFVKRLLDDGVADVGGFSLLCGNLKKDKQSENQIEPLAIISNRCGSSDDVPWIGKQRGEVYGLSNTVYDDPETWPKVEMGKEKVMDVIDDVVKNALGEEELVKKLYDVLDTDTLPKQKGQDFEDYIYQLRHSIFIPPIGNEESKEVPHADVIASAQPEVINGSGHAENHTTVSAQGRLAAVLKATERPTPPPQAPMTGLYGTQRQTIILVDWEGNASFRERSLWDPKGSPIERGHGDMKFEFKIDGWSS